MGSRNQVGCGRDGAPTLTRRPAASLFSLLGPGSRQRPREDPNETLGAILERALPKPLGVTLAEPLSIEEVLRSTSTEMAGSVDE